MKNTILLIFSLFSIISCTSPEEKKTNQSTSGIKTEVEKSYTGKYLNRFDQAIANMEKEDSTRMIRENEVLFVGSSSIRFWKTLGLDFDPIPAINRGFGGSTLPELIHYADRIIFPYNPKLIILYCGENDIAEGASPEEVFKMYKKLDDMIAAKLPNANLVFISMKPSVARWDLWDKYKAGNALIREYIESKEKREYLESADVMLTESGQPDTSIFVEDMLHMNEKGYAAWKELVRPIVEKHYKYVVPPSD